MPENESNPFGLAPATESAGLEGTGRAPSTTETIEDVPAPTDTEQAELAHRFPAIAAAYRDGKPRRIVIRAKVVE
jgi:hypothetical protein